MIGVALVHVLARAALLCFPAHFRRAHRHDFVEASLHLLQRERATFSSAQALARAARIIIADTLHAAPNEWIAGGLMTRNPSTRSIHATLGSIHHDGRAVLRGLRRHPLVTLTIVATLALGIGVSTAVFDALDRTLIHPLPFGRSGELRLLVLHEVNLGFTAAVPLAAFEEWRVKATTIRPLEVFRRQTVIESTTTEAHTVDGLGVSGGLPGMIGVRAVRGRVLVEADAAPNAPAVAMIGEAHWRDAYGADPSIVGRVVTLANAPTEIVGVWPTGARLDFEPPPAFVRPLPAGNEYRDGAWVQVIGRIADGASNARVESELATLMPPASPSDARLTLRPSLVTPANLLLGPEFVTGVWLAFGGGIVLLAAAVANASHLLLDRATARAPELALRGALGASRGRLVRLLSVEGAAYAALALGMGAPLARCIEVGLTHYEPRLFVDSTGAGLAGRALAFGSAVAVVACLACMLVAVARTRPGLASIAQSRVTPGTSTAVTFLVGVQAAMAIGLACAAILMGRSVARLSSVDPGIDADRLAELSVSLPATRFPTPASRVAYVGDAVERLRAIPTVTDVATSSMPLMLAAEMNGIPRLDGEPDVNGPSAPLMALVNAPHDFVRTVGLRLRAGRFYGSDETGVALVSESFAHDRRDRVLGRLLYLPRSTRPFTIVGVVGDVRYAGLANDDSRMPAVYLPTAPSVNSFLRFLVRTSGDPSHMLVAARYALSAIDPRVPVFTPDTGPAVIARQTARHRFVAVLLAGLAAGGCVLAMSGVYAAVALSVTRRRREFGVRLALGATADRLMMTSIDLSLRPILIGAAIGVTLAWFVTPSLKTLLFRIGAHDPSSCLAAAGLVLVTALGAAAGPSRRITRIDPATSLREL